MKIIARIKTDFSDKFGIPRQSGLVGKLIGRIIFENEYKNPDFIRGLEDFTYLWLIWGFSKNKSDKLSNQSTVRPPRLGGNKRMGVFATRSPFRPNSLGLSSVKLEKIEYSDVLGPVIYVSGIDMADNTPIYDIKPYLAYTDSHPDANDGFARERLDYSLEVILPSSLASILGRENTEVVKDLLSQDPRPSYQDDKERVYGMRFSDFEIKFKVSENILTVCDVIKIPRE